LGVSPCNAARPNSMPENNYQYPAENVGYSYHGGDGPWFTEGAY
jgi:hypothetical protein